MKDIVCFIVTIVLLSLFSGIVITGIVRNESLCLMLMMVSGLLVFMVLGYFIFQWREGKLNSDCKKTRYQELDKILEQGAVKVNELAHNKYMNMRYKIGLYK